MARRSKAVYALPHLNALTEYFDTLAEALATWRATEEPERIEVLSAAGECNRLTADVEAAEERADSAELALRDLVAVCPLDCLRQTPEGRAALALLRKIAPEFLKDCGLE